MQRNHGNGTSSRKNETQVGVGIEAIASALYGGLGVANGRRGRWGGKRASGKTEEGKDRLRTLDQHIYLPLTASKHYLEGIMVAASLPRPELAHGSLLANPTIQP